LATYFIFESRSETEYEYAIQNINILNNFTYCYRNPYFQNWPGRVIPILIVVFRDGFTLIIQIILSLYSIYMFKKYLNEQINQINETNNEYNSKQMLNRIQEYNDNLTKMTLYLSFCSIMCNFIVGSAYVLVSYNIPSTSLMRLLNYFANLFGIIKYFSNFFLFYYFNQKFRTFITVKCFRAN